MIITFFVMFDDIVELLNQFTLWVEERPVVGIMLIMICFIVGITVMIPTTLFIFVLGLQCYNLLGGALGYFIALFLVYFCAASGSTLAFLFSRYLLKETILSAVKPNWYKTRAILKALESNGFKLVLLFRLAPIFPFSLLNYALGASSVKLQDYLFASIGLIPKQALYVYVAVSVGSLQEAVKQESSNKTQLIIILSIGAVLGIIAATYLTIIAKREFNKIIKETHPLLGNEEHNSIIEGE
jgi:uncharacterized membrane protein YdjX (TVP38/TMEM64 family)